MRIIAGATFEGSGEGLTCEAIAGYIGESERATRRILNELSNQEFGEFGQCLVRCNDRFLIAGVRAQEASEVYESTGGWAALEAAARNPHIEERSLHSWKDEVLTGMTRDGKQSEINRAVLGKGGRKSAAAKAEDMANRSNRRFASEQSELKKQKLRYCPRCKAELIERGRTMCKKCNRNRMRDRRRAK